MTVTDAEAVEAIRTFTAEHGYPPTLREVAYMVGVRSSAQHIVDRLISRGLVTREAGNPRTLRVVDCQHLVWEPIERVVTVEGVTWDQQLCKTCGTVRAFTELRPGGPITLTLPGGV
jgi:repressor LexA